MGEFDILRASAAGMEAERAALDLAARNVVAAQADSGHGGFDRLVPRFVVAAPVRDDVPEPDAPSADDDEVPIRYLGAIRQPGAEVDAVTEMVAVLNAQRAYEADASVFDIGKRLSERTIDMGRLS